MTIDQEIRAGSFEVVTRPADGPALWRRRGQHRTYTTWQALAVARREEPYRDVVVAAKEDQAKRKRGV